MNATSPFTGYPYNKRQAEVGRSHLALCHHYTSLTFHHIQKGISLSGNSVSSAVGDSMTYRRAHTAAVMLRAAYSRGGFLIPWMGQAVMDFNLHGERFSCMLACGLLATGDCFGRSGRSLAMTLASVTASRLLAKQSPRGQEMATLGCARLAMTDEVDGVLRR